MSVDSRDGSHHNDNDNDDGGGHTNNGTMGPKNSNNNGNNNSGNGTNHSRHHMPQPLKRMLAALEHFPHFNLLGRRKASEEQAAQERNELHVKTNVILHGTTDPDGHVQDIFYDAVEIGDGHHCDEFKVEYRRESIVLNNILERQSTSDLPALQDAAAAGTNSQVATVNSITRLPPAPPKPPKELPLRFLRAGKGDTEEGLKRYRATLAWRKEQGMDTILGEPNENFGIIKQHYPHFLHLRGKDFEPCYYEQPPKTNLKAMKQAGVTLDALLRHYAMVTEFQWQYLERDDLARSITVIDLQGMRFLDFAGEVIDFVKRASEFTGQHYPERAGYVFVINVPGWFKAIWTVVKPMVDESTLEKIYILRGKDEVRESLLERIPQENIPPEYGGTSMPLGESPEELLLRDLIAHNNALARGEQPCTGSDGSKACRFCSWQPARSY